ncbi:MAG: hypothetical protein R2704_12560 [Microthrixaceae bacterium]
MTIPIVFIGEATLVAGRQATNNALGQEDLRAVDASMSEIIGEIRLDEFSVNNGCQGPAPASGSAVFPRPQTRPKQGLVNIEIRCSPEPGSVSPAGRVLNFEAYVDEGSGWVLRGKARAKYVDMLGASPEPGVELLVCDWQLGNDAGALAAC